jgi:hypothetical protein
MIDLAEAEKADFSIYEMDIMERHIRIPYQKELYKQKLAFLSAFQAGKDIWKEEKRY